MRRQPQSQVMVLRPRGLCLALRRWGWRTCGLWAWAPQTLSVWDAE